MVISFKVSNETRNKMIKYYEDKKRDKTPDYALFQADEGGTVITLYSSNKAVFQGISADVDANIWKETEANITGVMPLDSTKKPKEKKDEKTLYEERQMYYYINSIGSDEVGTGDYFGPIVVTATYVSKDDIPFLEELKVKDSKKLTDEKIMEIAPIIMKQIPYESVTYSNKDYNTHDYNMNKVKAMLHNQVLLGLMKKKDFNYDKVVIDQFCAPYNYFKYLNELKEEGAINNVFRKISFTTKGEDKCLSVACGSIISRYVFINEMNKMAKMVGKSIPKGAGTSVDLFAKELIKEKGKDILNDIAKLNFKNTLKIKED